MKLLLVAGLIGLAVAAVRPGAVVDAYRQIYPNDPAKQQALNACIRQQPGFDRLDSRERAACYRRELPQLLAVDIDRAPPRVERANFVDLWRAAGVGHVPQNDVRAAEENQRYLHPTARSGH